MLSLELHSHKQFVFEMKILATISNASFLWTYWPDSKSVAVFKLTLSFLTCSCRNFYIPIKSDFSFSLKRKLELYNNHNRFHFTMYMRSLDNTVSISTVPGLTQVCFFLKGIAWIHHFNMVSIRKGHFLTHETQIKQPSFTALCDTYT